MAEDSDKKPGKIIKDSQKALVKSQQDAAKKAEVANTYQNTSLKENAKVNKENLAKTSQLAISAKKTLTLNETVKTLQEQKIAADELRATGQIETANQIDEQIESTRKAIFKQDGTLKNLTGATNKVGTNIINAAKNDATKIQNLIDQGKELNAQQVATQSEGFKSFVDNLKEGQKANEVNDDMIEKALKQLGPTFGGKIDPAFTEFNNRLSDIQQMEKDGLVTQEQSNVMRQELLDATTDREKSREAQKAAELQSSQLTKIGDSISGFGDKLGNFGQSAIKTGGLLAGLIGLVIGVVDPELLSQIIQDFVTGFLEIVEGLVAFVTGDFEVAKQKIGDNILLFGGLVLGLALYFGGPLITAFGGLFGKLAKLVRMVKDFRVFMLSKFIPNMMSTLGSMLTGLGAVLIPILPIVAIIAVIAGAFYALKSSLGEGATVMDTLKLGALYLIDGLSMLVNGITFLPRKIFEFLGGGRLARWLFGDEVGDMVDSFLGEGLDTNRAGKFKEETKARLAQEKRDKELQEQAEAEGIYDLPEGIEIPDVTTGTDLTALGDETSAAQIAATGGAGGTQVMGANITNNTSSQAATTIMAVQPNPSRLALEGVTGR